MLKAKVMDCGLFSFSEWNEISFMQYGHQNDNISLQNHFSRSAIALDNPYFHKACEAKRFGGAWSSRITCVWFPFAASLVARIWRSYISPTPSHPSLKSWRRPLFYFDTKDLTRCTLYDPLACCKDTETPMAGGSSKNCRGAAVATQIKHSARLVKIVFWQ